MFEVHWLLLTLQPGPVGPLGSTKNPWVPVSFLYAVTVGEESHRDGLGSEEGGHLERTVGDDASILKSSAAISAPTPE